MLLENKVAVIYGAGGAIGGTVAKAFAREGARVFLTGRNLGKVDALTEEIVTAGGKAEAAKVDALEEEQIEEHLSSVAKSAGRIDISFNAITPVPQPGVQGVPIAKLPVNSFTAPITAYLRSHFLTARAAARRMVEKGAGVILMHTPEPARLGAALVGGMGPAWAAMEGFNRNLSAEFGPRGVRSVCIRSTGLPETHTIDVVFGLHAEAMGITREQFQGFVESLTHTKRSTKVAEVADAAVWLASDKASAITGTVLNLTGGLITD
ncbi:SDR family oxidoreductase [Acidobacteria bacterium AB60]|nr:SDR family oxidoreductase [Acidobacteria bacterium AB60]